MAQPAGFVVFTQQSLTGVLFADRRAGLVYLLPKTPTNFSQTFEVCLC
jgi:hypothetical protein